jgi:hypothetical protein
MRLPRPRFTVLRLMIVVAVVAVACGFEMCRRRRDTFKARSNLHTIKSMAFDYVRLVKHSEYEALRRSPNLAAEYFPQFRRGRGQRKAPVLEEIMEKAKFASETNGEAARYHAQMRDKYEYAARYPWLPVAPDPPEPK